MRACIAYIILASIVLQPALYLGESSLHSVSREISASAMPVPQDFVLEYATREYNDTNVLVGQSTLNLSSNGSARFVYSPGEGLGDDISILLDADFVNYIRQSMDEDDLCSFNGTYNDARAPQTGLARHMDEFAINTPCGSRHMVFSGDAMLGILPRTYVAMNKLSLRMYWPNGELLQINVDVGASLQPNGMLNISAAVRNNASHNYSMTSICQEIWPADIVRMNGCSVAHLRSTALPTCVQTVGPGESYTFHPKSWNASGLAEGKYVVMVDAGICGMTTFEVTEDLGHTNSAPSIYVEASEQTVSDGHTFEFDASGCCDVEDIGSDLEVRWDWYSDGTWDMDWSFGKTAEFTFSNMTGYNFTIEVRDTDGLVSSVSQSLTKSTGTTVSPLLLVLAIMVPVGLAVLAILVLKKRQP